MTYQPHQSEDTTLKPMAHVRRRPEDCSHIAVGASSGRCVDCGSVVLQRIQPEDCDSDCTWPACACGVATPWVPIHPRTGPLWAMTTDNPNPERLPGSYPLRSLVFADGVVGTLPEKAGNAGGGAK